MAQLLDIDPAEDIPLERKPGSPVTGYIRLYNVRGGNVAFKVKTTKPDLYNVRPVQGILSTGKMERVQVTLKVLPREVTELGHRFCVVQGKTDLNPGDEDMLNDFWLRENLSITQKVLKTQLLEKEKSPEKSPIHSLISTYKRSPRLPKSHKPQELPPYRDIQRVVLTQNSELSGLTKQLQDMRVLMQRREEEDEQTEVKKPGWSGLHLLVAVLLGYIVGLLWLK